MKTRHGFVSNSSSSSFVINGTWMIEDDLIAVIKDSVFYISMKCGDKAKECMEAFTDLVKNKKVFVIDCEDEWGNVGFDNLTYESIKLILEKCKEYNTEPCLSTGGTSSEILPQAMVQSYLIDKNVDYEVCGDGSFDMRKSDDITEILKHYDYPGACGAILKYYHGQNAGDENPSE